MGCGASSSRAGGRAGADSLDVAPSLQPRESGAGHAGVASSAARVGPLDEGSVEKVWGQAKEPLGLALKALALALKAAPFGEPVAACILLIYEAACQATMNKDNCMRLVALVQACGEALKGQGALERVGREQPERLEQLMGALQDALALVQAFGPRNFLMRIIKSGGDKADFERVHANLSTWMLALAFLHATAPPPVYTDDSNSNDPLVKSLCAKGGSSDPRTALLQLKQQGRLGELRELQGLQGLGQEVLSAMMDELSGALTEAVARLDTRLQGLSSHVEGLSSHLGSRLDLLGLQLSGRVGRIEALLGDREAERKEEGQGALPAYLRAWWNEWLDELEDAASGGEFLHALVRWFKDKGKESLLSKYDAKLQQDGFLDIFREEGGQEGKEAAEEQAADQSLFMKMVMLRLADEDRDDRVTKGELYRLQIKANEWALRRSKDPEPSEVSELCTVIFKNFDREQLRREATLRRGAGQDLRVITDGLNVTDIVNSYQLSKLTSQYHEGSRQWMYDRVHAWLDATTGAIGNATAGTAGGVATDASRLFLLLADAGMGKSVFSAVMATKLEVRSNHQSDLVLAQHFFKVGEPRVQGRSMVLCLAQQLAEQLEGFASVLAPVVREHGDGRLLGSLKEVFERYLLQPLAQLHSQAPSPPARVLLLLDALDESDDAGRGWEPVTLLIANDFLQLPPWVQLILTSRPQVRDWFASWTPQHIDPSDPRNQDDIRGLILHRLRAGGYVREGDVEAATQLLLERSQGQFIYTKFAFEALHTAQLRLSNTADPYTHTKAESQGAHTGSQSQGKGPLGGLPGASPWPLSSLASLLPPGTGVQAMYLHSLQTLNLALGLEQPELWEVLTQRLLPVLVAAREALSLDELVWAVDAPKEQVELLVRLLGNLFPLRNGCITPYHKSVMDWLVGEGPAAFAAAGTGAGTGAVAGAGAGTGAESGVTPPGGPPHPYVVNASFGHARLARCCATLLLDSPLQSDGAVQGGGEQKGAATPLQVGQASGSATVATAASRFVPPSLVSAPVGAVGEGYAVRHGVAHACQRYGSSQLLLQLLLDLGVWLRIIRAGHGPDVLADLSNRQAEAPHSAMHIVTDVLRWLRFSPSTLSCTDAQALLASALMCPVQSSVFRAAEAAALCLPAPLRPMKTIAAVGWSAWPALESTLQGHTGAINCIAYSPDGSRLASASDDSSVRLWDATTGQSLGILGGAGQGAPAASCSPTSLPGHSGWVRAVCFSPDGARLASGGDDKVWMVWEVATGRCLSRGVGHSGAIRCLAFSQDGARLVSGSNDRDIRVWEVGGGVGKCGEARCVAVLHGHTDTVHGVAWSSDGGRVVSASGDRTVKVWEIPRSARDVALGSQSGGGDVTACTCVATLTGHSDRVLCVSLSADGRRAASGGKDKLIHVWDVGGGGGAIGTLSGHTGAVHSVAFSPWGGGVERLVSGGEDRSVRVWELVGSGRCAAVLDGHAGAVLTVACSPVEGAEKVASAGGDKTLRVWNVRDAAALTPGGKSPNPGKGLELTMPHAAAVRAVAFGPGQRVASASDDRTVKVWKFGAEAGVHTCVASLAGHTGTVRGVAWSADGKRIASGSADTTVKVWEAGAGGVDGVWRCAATLEGHANTVRCVAFSHGAGCGRWLASASSDKSVKVWDASSGLCVVTLLGHSGAVHCVAFDPSFPFEGEGAAGRGGGGNRMRLASAADDDMVRVWEVEVAGSVGQGRCIATLSGHTQGVFSVAFGGGRLASAGGDGLVKVWDASTLVCTSTLLGHTEAVLGVAFLGHEAERLVSCGKDRTLRVWEVWSGKCVAVVPGHTCAVLGVAVSVVAGEAGRAEEGCGRGAAQGPGARGLVASGDSDGTLRLWDISTLD